MSGMYSPDFDLTDQSKATLSVWRTNRFPDSCAPSVHGKIIELRYMYCTMIELLVQGHQCGTCAQHVSIENQVHGTE
jgi:hypothetical protein